MFKYTAMIIEPRKHRALRYVLQNFLRNLSPEWGIIVFHGCNNKAYVENVVESIDNHRISLFNLQVEDLDAYAYSHLLISESLYAHIPTETFLVFQTDSIMLDENKHKLDLFLKYDYVGAPWAMGINHGGLVGNGGLSLRKKSKMLEIIRSKGYVRVYEDDYFSKNIDSAIQYNVPSFEVAKDFSVETVYSESPFGVHKCWNYGYIDKRIETLLDIYPAIRELMALQGTDSTDSTDGTFFHNAGCSIY